MQRSFGEACPFGSNRYLRHRTRGGKQVEFLVAYQFCGSHRKGGRAAKSSSFFSNFHILFPDQNL